MNDEPLYWQPGMEIDAPFYTIIQSDWDAIRVFRADTQEELDAKVAAYEASLPPAPNYSRVSTLAWRFKWWVHDRLFAEDDH